MRLTVPRPSRPPHGQAPQNTAVAHGPLPHSLSTWVTQIGQQGSDEDGHLAVSAGTGASPRAPANDPGRAQHAVWYTGVRSPLAVRMAPTHEGSFSTRFMERHDLLSEANERAGAGAQALPWVQHDTGETAVALLPQGTPRHGESTLTQAAKVEGAGETCGLNVRRALPHDKQPRPPV